MTRPYPSHHLPAKLPRALAARTSNMDINALANPLLITGAIGAALAYVKLQGRSVALRIKQTDRLYSLLRSGAWQSTHPGSLQLAVEQAFGKLIDDRLIKDALRRHDGLRMLRDSIRADPSVRWDSQYCAFIDNRLVKRISFKFWIALHAAVLFGTLATALIALPLALLAAKYAFAAMFTFEVIVISFCAGDSLVSNAAARRLLDPSRHPVIEKLTVPAEKPPRPHRRIGATVGA